MQSRTIVLAAILALAAGSLSVAWFVRSAETAPTADLPNFTLSQPAKPVPPATFQDDSGQAIDLSAFKGKVALVNLWATWCAPCRAEMPALDRLQAEMGSPEFQVVAIAQDHGGRDKVRSFLDSVGARHLKLYIDPSMRSGRVWGAIGLPTSFIIDREGRELGRIVGPAEWDSPEAKAMIRRFIGKRPADPQLRTEAAPRSATQ